MRAPRAGPRMVLAVCAALCEEGSHRSGRVHERKALLHSETLAVGGQDAERHAGRKPGLRLEGRGGGSKASTRGLRDGQRTSVIWIWKGGDGARPTPIMGSPHAGKCLTNPGLALGCPSREGENATAAQGTEGQGPLSTLASAQREVSRQKVK